MGGGVLDVPVKKAFNKKKTVSDFRPASLLQLVKPYTPLRLHRTTGINARDQRCERSRQRRTPSVSWHYAHSAKVRREKRCRSRRWCCMRRRRVDPFDTL